jgi:hypothetical protein
MPYEIKKGKGKRPWKITKHGKVVGTSNSKKKAEAARRARYANSPDPKPEKKTWAHGVVNDER